MFHNEILSSGKLVITPNHAYIGPNRIDLTKDTDTVYIHPTSKQCNYSYSHPSSKQCSGGDCSTLSGYSYSQIIANAASSSLKYANGTTSGISLSAVNTEQTITISYSGAGFSTTPAIMACGVSTYTNTSYRTFYRAISVRIISSNATSASLGIATVEAAGTGTVYWLAIGK